MSNNIPQASELNRFTLRVLKAKSIGSQTMISGIAHGEYKASDKFYLSGSRIPVVELNVAFKSMNGDQTELYLENNLPENLENTIVSNVEPIGGVDVDKAIENPLLLAFVRDYRENYKNKDFFNEFCFAFVHAKFLVPFVSNSKNDKKDAQGKITVEKGATIGFPLLETPNGRKMLPIFTDWGALGKWEKFKNSGEHNVLILPFEDVASIMKDSSEGILINPFDTLVPMPKEVIHSIQNSEAYKNENKISTRKASRGTNIKVGLPKETEEIKLVSEVIVNYSKSHEIINEAHLFLKLEDNETEPCLFVVFDISYSATDDDKHKIFEEVHKQLIPVMGLKKHLDFALKAPNFIKLCNSFPPLYKKD